MTRLFGTIASAAMACACLAAGVAVAKATTDRQRAAYLSCYRKVLQQPEFAALDPAGLYAIRDAQLAEAVIAGCSRQVRPYRDELAEVARRSQAKALARGGTQLPIGRLMAITDMGLRFRIGSDLAEADPRVKPIADADPSNASERPRR